MAIGVDFALGKLAKAIHAAVGRTVPTFLAALVPPRFWYPAMLHLSGALAPIHKLCSKDPYSTAIHKAHLLQRFIALCTCTQRPFPIAWRASGAELLSNGNGSKGIVLCSAHIPLVRMAVTAAVALEAPLSAAVMVNPPKGGQMPVLGTNVHLPTLTAGPAVLLKARSILSSGGSVMLLVDHYTGGAYSPNAFQLAGRVGARMVFFFVELEANGTIAVRFVNPPDPSCATDEGIAANLAALHTEIQNILCKSSRVTGRSQPAPARLSTGILPD